MKQHSQVSRLSLNEQSPAQYVSVLPNSLVCCRFSSQVLDHFTSTVSVASYISIFISTLMLYNYIEMQTFYYTAFIWD